MTDRSDTDPQRLTDQISAAMIHNAGLFLKKAAEEIAAHVDGPNAAFDIDRATQVTVLMQIAVELSATAIVLKQEGFDGVMKSKDRSEERRVGKERVTRCRTGRSQYN